MKKLISISLLVICAFLFVGCANTSNSNDTDSKKNVVSEEDPKDILQKEFNNEVKKVGDYNKIKDYINKGCDPNSDLGIYTAYEMVLTIYKDDDLVSFFAKNGGDASKFKLKNLNLETSMLQKMKKLGANITDDMITSSKKEESNINVTSNIEPIPKIDGFEITNMVATDYVTGKIKNTIGYKCSSIYIYINILDTKGNVIQSTIDSMNDLNIGDTWIFKAPVINVNGEYKYQVTSIKSFK